MSQLPKRKPKAPERFQVMEKRSFSADYQKKKENVNSLQKQMYQLNYKEATKAMAEIDEKKHEDKKQKVGKTKSGEKKSGGKYSNKENQKKEEKEEKFAMRTQKIKENQKIYREKAKEKLEEKKKKEKIYLDNYRKMKKNRK